MSSKPLNIDDKQLVLLCQKKDRKAQNFLFEKYKKKVLFICMRYNSNTEVAKDILQDAFIKIFKSLMHKENADIKALDTWIYKIAIRTAIDDFRKNNKLNFLEDVNDHFISTDDCTPIERLSAQELLDVIQKMPDGYRIIFNLYIIEGYGHSEISKMLDITKGTSRSQLARAKNWLKKRLYIINNNHYERIFG